MAKDDNLNFPSGYVSWKEVGSKLNALTFFLASSRLTLSFRSSMLSK